VQVQPLSLRASCIFPFQSNARAAFLIRAPKTSPGGLAASLLSACDRESLYSVECRHGTNIVYYYWFCYYAESGVNAQPGLYCADEASLARAMEEALIGLSARVEPGQREM
jgi:hypothetical protein